MSDTLEFPEIEPAATEASASADPLLDELRRLHDAMRELIGDAAEQDEKLWHGLLEGQTDGPDKLCQLIDQALIWEAQVAGLKLAIERYESHIARLEAAAKATRVTAKAGMQILELKSLRAPNFRANLADGRPSVEVFDINLLPADYKKIEITARRELIADDIKAGKQVPGARLNPPPLTLRVTKL